MGAHEEGRGHHARLDAPRRVRIPMVPGTDLRGRAAAHARRDLSRERRKPSVDHGCARLAASLTILSFTWALIRPINIPSPDGDRGSRMGRTLPRGRHRADRRGHPGPVTLPIIPMIIPSLAPASVPAGLDSIHSQSVLYGTTWGLYLVSDLLYLIPFAALYVVLRPHHRVAALIALIFNSLFVTIDVAVGIPLRLALISLSNAYTAANPAGPGADLANAPLGMDLANITALLPTFGQLSAG